MKVLSNGGGSETMTATSFWRWVCRRLFIIGLAVVIALVSVLAEIQLAVFLLVSAGVGVWLFQGGTTCKEVCAFDFIFRFGGFLALCMMLFLLFFPLHETIQDARKEILAKADPQLTVFLTKNSPPFKIIALEPDEKRDLSAILKNAKPLGTMTILRQKYASAKPQTAYSLTLGASLRFDKDWRVLNARFSREDEEKLTTLIQNAAARL